MYLYCCDVSLSRFRLVIKHCWADWLKCFNKLLFTCRSERKMSWKLVALKPHHRQTAIYSSSRHNPQLHAEAIFHIIKYKINSPGLTLIYSLVYTVSKHRQDLLFALHSLVHCTRFSAFGTSAMVLSVIKQQYCKTLYSLPWSNSFSKIYCTFRGTVA